MTVSGLIDDDAICNAVKSNELKWLPNGSEFVKEQNNSNSTSKPMTYTSFSCSQDSLLQFSNNSILPDDIIIAKLGPGQVRF